MAGAAALAVSLAALAAGAVDVELGAAAQARSRNVVPETGPRRSFVELELAPRADVEARLGRLSLAGFYAARLYSPDVFGPTGDLWGRTNLLNLAQLRAELPVVRTWRLAAAADAAYGLTDLLADDIWLPAAVPTTGRLRYVSASGGLGLSGRTSTRTTWSGDAGAFLSGGADAEARETIPRQRGLNATLGVERLATPRDRLSAQLRGTAARFDGGLTSGLLVAMATWRHQATPALGTTLGAGFAATFTEPPGEPRTVTPAPWAEAGVSHAPGGTRPSESLGVRAEPIIDRLTGAVALRLEATADVSWTPAPRWSLGGRATAADVRALEEGTGTGDTSAGLASSVGALELRAGRDVGRYASIAGGLYGRYQYTDRPGLPSFLEWGAFLSFTLASGRR